MPVFNVSAPFVLSDLFSFNMTGEMFGVSCQMLLNVSMCASVFAAFSLWLFSRMTDMCCVHRSTSGVWKDPWTKWRNEPQRFDVFSICFNFYFLLKHSMALSLSGEHD